MVILSQVFETKPNYFALTILAFCLMINAVYYIFNINDWAYKSTYPKWKTEVVKWRSDTTYKLKIHPAFNKDDEWTVKL